MQPFTVLLLLLFVIIIILSVGQLLQRRLPWIIPERLNMVDYYTVIWDITYCASLSETKRIQF